MGRIAAAAVAAVVAVLVVGGCGTSTSETTSVAVEAGPPADAAPSVSEGSAGLAAGASSGDGGSTAAAGAVSLDDGPAIDVTTLEDPVAVAAGSDPFGPALPAGDAEPDGAQPLSDLGDSYAWSDGDKQYEAWLLPDFAAVDADEVSPDSEVVVASADFVITSGSSGSGAAGASGGAPEGGPVFMSQWGQLMALPGGVLIGLDETWDSAATDAFFGDNDISLDRVSELDYITNGFFVETEPGFASLDLANRLAALPGVEFSSPNWWLDVSAS